MFDTDLAVVILKQVSSLLADALPTAHVNLLYDEGEDDAVAMGIEVRPRERPFKSSAFMVPPAKWTVAILKTLNKRHQFRDAIQKA